MSERNFKYKGVVTVITSSARCSVCNKFWNARNSKSVGIQHTKFTGHVVYISDSYEVIGVPNG